MKIKTPRTYPELDKYLEEIYSKYSIGDYHTVGYDFSKVAKRVNVVCRKLIHQDIDFNNKDYAWMIEFMNNAIIQSEIYVIL